MSWTIHIRKDERLYHYTAEDLAAALAVVALLLPQGITVECIDEPSGFRISEDAIRALCEGGEAQKPARS